MTECTCFPVPEEYHFVYYGITEPGSMWEPNPDCREHFPGDQPAKAMERRANLLAGLNEAPAALIGWDVEDRSHVRLRDGRLIPAYRYRRLDGMWWHMKGGAYAERVRMDQAERYFALTGRRLPDAKLRYTKATEAAKRAESSLQRFAGALQGIADAFAEAASRIVFPRVPLADPSQDDVVKGA